MSKQYIFSCGHKRPVNDPYTRNICRICKAAGIKTKMVGFEIKCPDCGLVFRVGPGSGKRVRCKECTAKRLLEDNRAYKVRLRAEGRKPKAKRKKRMCECCGNYPIMDGNVKLCIYCYKGIDARTHGWDYSGLQVQTMDGRGFE